jgi:fatty-acyl-CoA synthase
MMERALRGHDPRRAGRPGVGTMIRFALDDVGVGSWPARRARITPGRIALRHQGRSWTYAELFERTEALARALRRLEVAPGDRVAYLGNNHPAFLETLFAVGHAGAVLVPLNTRLSAAELAYVLADSGSVVLVVSAELADTAREALDAVHAVRQVIQVGDAPEAIAGAMTYEEWLNDAADGEPVDVPVTFEDPCMIIYTSGTTGRPKGAVITHGNVTWNTVNQLAHVDILSDDVALAVAPLFHTAGLNQVTMPTLFKGGAVVVPPRFDAGELLETVGREHITAFSAVPTILQMIADHPAWDASDLSSLRHVVYGGSPVSERVARAWLARGVPLLQGFGMTEASPGVLMAVADGAAERPVSTGVPHFFTDVAVLADDVPQPPQGRTGELLVRGPNVFGGYWRRDEETAGSFLEGGWFRSGDVVRVDRDGWAYVVDRVKDMIISGGENVYPAEVEAALDDHPAVASCALVGVPDQRWGEVGLLYVAPQPGMELDEASVISYLQARLARYKVPKYIRFVEALPTTAVGKVRRADLRRAAMAEPPEAAQSTGSEHRRASP